MTCCGNCGQPFLDGQAIVDTMPPVHEKCPTMSQLVAEVCREHRASDCGVCDENNDDLWIHPTDLPAPHEDCPLCHQLVRTREWNIQQLQRSIDLTHSEIADIENGMRHTGYHAAIRATPKK